MDQSIRKRKVPLPNLDRAAYLERFKKATEAWSGKTFQHFETQEQWDRYKAEVAEGVERGDLPF
jgi:hypothetical protein